MHTEAWIWNCCLFTCSRINTDVAHPPKIRTSPGEVVQQAVCHIRVMGLLKPKVSKSHSSLWKTLVSKVLLSWLYHTSCCYLGQKVKNKGEKEHKEVLVFPPKNPNVLLSAHSFIFTDQESSTGCSQLLPPALAWTVVVMVLLMKSHWLGLQIVFIW